MHSIPNRGRAGGILVPLALALLTVCAAALRGSDEPGRLTIVPDSGLIILDSDTLDLSGPSTLEIPTGEHLLRYFPLEEMDRWANSYIEYSFIIGPSGQKTIDLSLRAIFHFRTNPESADLEYRGRFVGRTPGDYLFLVGTEDSLLVKKEYYQTKAVYLDRVFESGTDVLVTLEPESPDALYRAALEEEGAAPFRKLFSADLICCLAASAGLLSGSAYYNNLAEKHYERYLRLIGREARESEYHKARKNDRLSKAAVVAGDAALGLFGYLIIRRFILPARSSLKGRESGKSRLSMEVSTQAAAMQIKF